MNYDLILLIMTIITAIVGFLGSWIAFKHGYAKGRADTHRAMGIGAMELSVMTDALASTYKDHKTMIAILRNALIELGKLAEEAADGWVILKSDLDDHEDYVPMSVLKHAFAGDLEELRLLPFLQREHTLADQEDRQRPDIAEGIVDADSKMFVLGDIRFQVAVQ